MLFKGKGNKRIAIFAVKVLSGILLIYFFVSIIFTRQSGERNDFPQWERISQGVLFPDGPTWDKNGTLFFSSIATKIIYKYSNGQTEPFLKASPSTFKEPNGLFYRDGSLYVCDQGAGKILVISEEGVVKEYAGFYKGEPLGFPNDLVFDSQGNMFFTAPISWEADGRIFRVSAENRNIDLVADNLAFPNGIAISPVDGRLYVAETGKERVFSFIVNDIGELSDKTIFIELPGGHPDGLIFDALGNLYVAHFNNGAVYVISPAGKIRAVLPTPGSQPTNLEFGGTDLKTLFLTEVSTQSVYQLRFPVSGANGVTE